MNEEVMMKSRNFRQLDHQIYQDLTKLILTSWLDASGLEQKYKVFHRCAIVFHDEGFLISQMIDQSDRNLVVDQILSVGKVKSNLWQKINVIMDWRVSVW
jgi:hypothetical protein